MDDENNQSMSEGDEIIVLRCSSQDIVSYIHANDFHSFFNCLRKRSSSVTNLNEVEEINLRAQSTQMQQTSYSYISLLSFLFFFILLLYLASSNRRFILLLLKKLVKLLDQNNVDEAESEETERGLKIKGKNNILALDTGSARGSSLKKRKRAFSTGKSLKKVVSFGQQQDKDIFNDAGYGSRLMQPLRHESSSDSSPILEKNSPEIDESKKTLRLFSDLMSQFLESHKMISKEFSSVLEENRRVLERSLQNPQPTSRKGSMYGNQSYRSLTHDGQLPRRDSIESQSSEFVKPSFGQYSSMRKLSSARVIQGDNVDEVMLMPTSSNEEQQLFSSKSMYLTSGIHNSKDGYDLFLSHKQVEGGDQCHSLSCDLWQMNISNWYDQRQRNITEEGMMKGIQKSKAFMLFVTDTVFDSEFVRKETMEAIRLQKRIVLVYEKDPDRHGAASWINNREVLQNEKLKDYPFVYQGLFGNDGPAPIPFHRFGTARMSMIKEIAFRAGLSVSVPASPTKLIEIDPGAAQVAMIAIDEDFDKCALLLRALQVYGVSVTINPILSEFLKTSIVQNKAVIALISNETLKSSNVQRDILTALRASNARIDRKLIIVYESEARRKGGNPEALSSVAGDLGKELCKKFEWIPLLRKEELLNTTSKIILEKGCLTSIPKWIFPYEFDLTESISHFRDYEPGTREWLFKEISNWFVSLKQTGADHIPHRRRRSSIIDSSQVLSQNREITDASSIPESERSHAKSQNTQILLLIGAAGTGKSVVMSELVRRGNASLQFSNGVTVASSSLGIPVVAYHFFSFGRFSSAITMVRSICVQLAGSIPGFQKFLPKRESDFVAVSLQECLNHLWLNPLLKSTKPSNHSHVAIVIDAIDECHGSEKLLMEMRDIWPKMPLWIALIVSSRPKKDIVEEFLSITGDSDIINISDVDAEEHNRQDIAGHVQRMLQRLGRESDVLLHDAIVSQADGLFLWLKLHTPTLLNLASEAKLTAENVLLLSKGTRDTYASFFKRLLTEIIPQGSEERKRKVYQDVLAIVLCVREPIPISVLRLALGYKDDGLFQTEVIGPVSSLLSIELPSKRRALPTFTSFNDTLVSCPHQSMSDFLLGRDGENCWPHLLVSIDSHHHAAIGLACSEILDQVLNKNSMASIQTPRSRIAHSFSSSSTSSVSSSSSSLGTTNFKEKASQFSEKGFHFALRQGFFHLLEAREYEKSKQYFLDPRRIYSRLTIGNDDIAQLIQEGLQYTNETGEPHGSVGLVVGALQLSARILRERPREIISQLIGRIDLQFQTNGSYSSLSDEKKKIQLNTQAELNAMIKTLTNLRFGEIKGTVADNSNTLAKYGSTLWWLPSAEALAKSGGARLNTFRCNDNDLKFSVYSHQGDKLITESKSKTLVWNTLTGDLVYTLGSGQQSFSSLCFSPDGEYILGSSSQDAERGGGVFVFNAQSGILVKKLEGLISATSAVFSPDQQGSRILTSSYDGKLRIYDTSSFELLYELEASPSTNNNANSDAPLTGFAARRKSLSTPKFEGALFHPQGQYAIGWAERKGIFVFSCRIGVTPIKKCVVATEQPNFTAVLFGPAPNYYLLSGSSDGSVKVNDIESGTSILTLTHQHPISSVSINEKFLLIASSSIIYLYNSEAMVSQDPVKTITVSQVDDTVEANEGDTNNNNDNVNGLSISATTTDSSGQSSDNGGDLLYSVKAIAQFLPESNLIVSYFQSNNAKTRGAPRIVIWDSETCKMVGKLEGHTKEILSVTAFKRKSVLNSSPDHDVSSIEIVSTSKDETAIRWSIDAVLAGEESISISGKRKQSENDQRIQHSDFVSCISFNSDGTQCVSGGLDSLVILWIGLKDGRVFKGHTSGIWSVSFGKGDSWILSCSEDKTIKIWDLMGNILMNFVHNNAAVRVSIFSSSYKLVLSGDEMGNVKLWSTENGNELIHLSTAHTTSVRCAAISDDERYAVTGSKDGYAVVWDVQTGSVLYKLSHNDIRVSCVAIYQPGLMPLIVNPSSSTTNASGVVQSQPMLIIATACGDLLVRIWCIPSEKIADSIRPSLTIGEEELFKSPLSKLDFSRDGEYIMCYTDEGQVNLFKLECNSYRIPIRYITDHPKSDDPLSLMWSTSNIPVQRKESGQLITLRVGDIVTTFTFDREVKDSFYNGGNRSNRPVCAVRDGNKVHFLWLKEN